MKTLLIIVSIGFFSCGQNSKNAEKTEKAKDFTIIHEVLESKTEAFPTIGLKIQGDFNGDKMIDFATAVKIKQGDGNPVENGNPDEFEIQFSDSNLKSIPVGCCEIRLINEGDLNNNGTEEISIFQAPMNGCTYSMTTYSFLEGNWKKIVKTFLIPTGCDEFIDDHLQKRIFKENNSIYFLDADLSDEQIKLVKKKAETE